MESGYEAYNEEVSDQSISNVQYNNLYEFLHESSEQADGYYVKLNGEDLYCCEYIVSSDDGRPKEQSQAAYIYLRHYTQQIIVMFNGTIDSFFEYILVITSIASEIISGISLSVNRSNPVSTAKPFSNLIIHLHSACDM